MATLGDLARARGVVDAATLERARVELRARARDGNPTSLARLLIDGGVPPARLLELSPPGSLKSIECDACGAAVLYPPSAKGRETPCTACGSFVLLVGAAPSPASPESDEPVAPPAEPVASVDAGKATLPFDAVLAPPGTAAIRTKVWFPTPEDPHEEPVSVDDVLRQADLAAAAAVSRKSPEEKRPAEGVTTLPFDAVIPLPSRRPAEKPEAPPAGEDERDTAKLPRVLEKPAGKCLLLAAALSGAGLAVALVLLRHLVSA